MSGGRLTLGVGLGSDRFAGELSRTGEELRDRIRADMLDEVLAILAAAWSGETVDHHGEHYVVDGIRFLPRPVQQPTIPVWVATLGGNTRPLPRAARHDGIFPVNLEHPDQLAALVADVAALRQTSEPMSATPYDVAVAVAPDSDPQAHVAAGATWLLVEFEPDGVSVDQVRGVARNGPPLVTR